MKCTIRMMLLAAMLAVSTPALAQKRFGAAGVTCAQYIKGARNSDITYHQASNWLLGYVSGINAMQSANGGAPAINLTNDQVLKSAADYCAANPQMTIAAAAGQWSAALPRQAAPEPKSERKPETKPVEAAREDNSILLNLEAPKLKPLLERH
jgi:hypothetical protein